MSFGPVQQMDAGLLNVGYVDVGPTDGQPVILLHGWPYDIHSYAEAAPALGTAGYVPQEVPEEFVEAIVDVDRCAT